MQVDENIFRAYDIRGIYKKQITEELAYKLGKAFATFNKGKIVVGRDPRIGGEELKKALIKGLLESGADVVDIGIVPTPMIIFSIGYYKYDGGICITASHNPREYQGFLLYNREGVGVGLDNGLEDIKKLIISEKFAEGSGKLENKDITNDYLKFISEKIGIEKINKKVVIDCGNGSASIILPYVLKKFGVQVYTIFCELDGNFPNREPEPKPDNLKELQKKVLELKADCGFAYDGDCDRVVGVDENGKILNPTEFFGVLIKLYLEKEKGKIVHDALSSTAIDEVVKYYEGLSIGCRVGHVFIQRELLKEDALIGGEISGHYFFREIYGADDAIFATLKILEYLEIKKIKMSETYRDIPSYYFDSIRVKTKEEIKFKFIEELKKEFLEKGYKIDCLDGVKVFLKEGWALFRASNTEPKISIAFEAKTKEDFEKLKKFVEQIIDKIECKQ
jgi:phosphomannomutase/phosphoglucomutase